MRLWRHLLRFFAILGVLGGCAAERAPILSSRPAVADFFPLRPGTLWVYEVRHARGEIALQRSIVKGPVFLRSKNTTGTIVEESGGMGGEFAFDVAWHPVAYYRRGEFLYKLSGLAYADSGVREVRIGRGEEKVLPANPIELRSWESDLEIFSLGLGAAYGMRVTSRAKLIRKAVKVRAGVFRNCLRVDTDTVAHARSSPPGDGDLRFHYIDWYAPGTGLIKSVVIDPEVNRQVTTIELVSFRPAGQ